ncbi:MFS transporter [Sporosarcina contaminans]|uniref:MFS transporter n=1 Tax=Sporosarcina contaminans TaxID=633403 RepID=A0ABW3TV86_9BACL
MKFNKNYFLLVTGQSIANIGDVLYMLSVISTIFALTGSAAASSFVPFTITTSMFLSSLLTPLIIGKVNLKWILASSQIGKTVLLTFLCLSLHAITVSNYYLLFIMIGMIAFLDGCANPIKQTLIPHYVKDEHLLKANGISESVTQTIQTIMWFAGSLLLVALGPVQLTWAVVGLFMISSMLLCLLQNVTHQKNEETGKLEQIKEGWIKLFQTPVLRKIAWIESVETIAGTVWIAAILYVFVSDALNVDEKWWGFINGAFFFGLIIGSVYCIKYAAFIQKRVGTSIFIGSLACCVVTLLFSFNRFPIIALILSLCIGFFGQLKSIPLETIIQKSVPKEQLAAVYTSLGTLGTGLFGISSVMMGILSDIIGVQMVFMLSGVMLLIGTVVLFRSRKLFT